MNDPVARDPNEVLAELLFGFLGTQLLYVAAQLGIADLIQDDQRESVGVLASRAGVAPDALYRYMRALAALGVFAEVDERVFAQTPASLLLRSDAATGWHEFAVVYGSVYRAFVEALPAARSGENMFERAFGMGWWEWLAINPDVGATFNRAMQSGAERRIDDLSGFPWHEVETVIDVGGGNGTLVVGLLQRHPHLRGVIFDLPEVAPAASATIAHAGLGGRCSVESGSVFEHVPGGGDVYVLAKVLHDWDDAPALQILQRVRAATTAETRLLVLDSVITPEASSKTPMLLDLVMLALVSGRERSPSEWRELLANGGWIATSVEDGLIEARAAP